MFYVNGSSENTKVCKTQTKNEIFFQKSKSVNLNNKQKTVFCVGFHSTKTKTIAFYENFFEFLKHKQKSRKNR
jgi:hypothetical protein